MSKYSSKILSFFLVHSYFCPQDFKAVNIDKQLYASKPEIKLATIALPFGGKF